MAKNKPANAEGTEKKTAKAKKKTAMQKLWYFIWEDNSLLSWAANILIAFVLIKFIIYPSLGLVLGTSYPVVAVVSGSMEHDGSFNDWWNSYAVCGFSQCRQKDYYASYNITKESFLSYPFKNGFNTGDLIVLVGSDIDELKQGDVVVFWANYKNANYPIIHRIIKIEKQGNLTTFTTKGDHNSASGMMEQKITEDRLLGKAIFRIPFLGWIKLAVFKLFSLAS